MSENLCPDQGIKSWTASDATTLCRAIESVCPAFGCHVALTGGTLYKDGLRKDVDILFYRIRQVPEIDIGGLRSALTVMFGIEWLDDYGWVKKADLHGRKIDFFFPEEQDGVDFEYTSQSGGV